MKTRIHAIAGVTGFIVILVFWTSTVISELFAGHDMVANIKSMILQGMFILVPAMIIVGGSGMAMGRRRKDTLTRSKKKRMPFIAMNGLLILIPAAWFLAGKSAAGEFDQAFYVVQVIELIAGAANLTLMALNIRDGLRMTGKLKRPAKS